METSKSTEKTSEQTTQQVETNSESEFNSSGFVFVDLRIDYAFKVVFGTPGNEDALLKLVNAILPEKNITAVTLDPNEQQGTRPKSRRSLIDVKCTTNQGDTLIIEMQVKKEDDLADRMVFYSSYPLVNRIVRGEKDNFTIRPLYLVAITDFIIPRKKPNPDLVNTYNLRNVRDSGEEFTGNLNYMTIELPKLPEKLSDTKNKSERFFYMIRNIGKMKEIPEELKADGLEKIFELARFAAMDPIIQEEYFKQLMAEIDERSVLRTARKDGFEEGLAEGKAEGLAEGEAKGKAEGEANARLETARNLIKLGVSAELISQATGLSAEEIKKL